MHPNYQPPSSLDTCKLASRNPTPRLNPSNNDTDSDPGGNPQNYNTTKKVFFYYNKLFKTCIHYHKTYHNKYCSIIYVF